MSSVDNRIVKMRFENGQFNNAANATMNTLKKLSNNLKLADGVKGLDNVAKKMKNVDTSQLVQGVETVRERFSAMEIIGVTALMNIANKAVNAGMTMAKSLTLDPIMDGFSEYETKMDALQTIMTNTANKGTTMDQIKNALNELNTYSDLTIYNFAQMTDNIGKFTAAGVGLEDSVIAIKGMSNVAAGFGVNATKMAGATYQMSQMLASGKMMAMDWNSMVQAGMAGETLQQAFIETAAGMGIVKDASLSFKDSLKDGWLTSEVFIETMKKMADDPSLLKAATNVTSFTKLVGTMRESVGSGWAMSWEYIFGDKDQSTALFTSINDGFSEIAGSMADYRNEALKTWNETGGREAVLKGMKNILESIGNILGPIYNSFKKIIDPWNGERLVSLSKGFEKITEKLKITDKTGALVEKTFDGIFSVFKLVGLILKPIGSLFTGLAGTGTPIIDMFFRITSSMTGWITKAVSFLESSGYVEKAMAVMSKTGETLSKVFQFLYTNGMAAIGTGLSMVKKYLGEFVYAMGEGVKAGYGKITGIKDFVIAFCDAYKPMERAKEFFVGVFESMKNGMQSFINFLREQVIAIKNLFSRIVEKIKELGIDGGDIWNAGLLAGLFMIIKKLVPLLKFFFNAVGTFKDSALGILDELGGVLEAYQKTIKAEAIKKIAMAIAILAGSVWVLSRIEPDRLIPAVAALGVLIGGIVAAMWAFNRINPRELLNSISSITALIGISIALSIAASALNKLAGIPWQGILVGITGMASIFLMLGVMMKVLNGVRIDKKVGASIITISVSILILAKALEKLGSLEPEMILTSLLTMSGVLTGLTVFFKSVERVGNPKAVAKSILPIALSMVILSKALAIFGSMDKNELTQGILILSGALIELAIFMKVASGFRGDMKSIGSGLLLLSTSIIILSGALGILGNMEPSTIIQGLLSIAASLGIFAIAMRVMPTNMPVFAGQIMILSAALLVLSVALRAMGGLSWSSLGKGLAGMAGSLAVFGVAAALLTPVIPVLGALSLALLGLGAASALIGGSLMLIATGMAMFSTVVGAGSAALVAALTAIIAIIPIFAAGVAKGLVSFVTILANNTGAIAAALTKLFAMLLGIIADNIPVFVNMIIVFVTEILNAIGTLAPKLVETIMNIVLSVLGTLAEGLPQIAGFVIDFIVNLITEVLSSLGEAIPKIASSITDIIVGILTAIGEGVPRIVNAMFDLVISMINGLADAISTKMPQVRSAVKNLVKAILNEFKECVKGAINIGGDIIEGLKNGISAGIQKVKDAAKNVAKAALNAAKDFLNINSPSRKFRELGDSCDEGLVAGFVRHSGDVEDAAVGVAKNALSSMRSAMRAVNDIINSDTNSGMTIRPVLDLSEIQNGTNRINDLLDGNHAIQATARFAHKTASNMIGGFGGNTQDRQVNETINYNTNEIRNEFHINGNNPEDIANEISSVIQKQVERRDAIWA